MVSTQLGSKPFHGQGLEGVTAKEATWRAGRVESIDLLQVGYKIVPSSKRNRHPDTTWLKTVAPDDQSTYVCITIINYSIK